MSDHASSANSKCAAVLVVEDDREIREALQQVLEIEGYAVSTADDGRAALERLLGMPAPCLVLLDLMMPVMDGREFLRALRADDRLAPIPVVVVSAWPKEVALSDPVQGIVRKPVDLDLLLELVGRYCHKAV